MIRQLLIILIIYLLLNQLILYFNVNSDSEEVIIKDNVSDVDSETKSTIDSDSEKVSSVKSIKSIKSVNSVKSVKSINSENSVKSVKKNNKDSKPLEEAIPLDLFGQPHDVKPNEYILWTFNEPVPWSQIIYTYGQDFPFKFFIKVKIPSLNDYQTWKQLIPNIDFESRSGELIIPSKNEASALALANLMISTFNGSLKIDDILEKNLIQISVMKAQQFELVRNKLREQLIDALKGKTASFQPNQTDDNDYEQDLAKTSHIKASNHDVENFNSNEPMAASDNEGYSYL